MQCYNKFDDALIVSLIWNDFERNHCRNTHHWFVGLIHTSWVRSSRKKILERISLDRFVESFFRFFLFFFSSIKIVKSLIQDRRKRSCELYQWMSRNMKERCYFHVPYNILDLSRWCYMCVENDWNDPSYQSNLCDSPA